jgi:hypothetical protein
MSLFRSEEHVRRWLRANHATRGEVLPLEQVWRLANAWYSDPRARWHGAHALSKKRNAFSHLSVSRATSGASDEISSRSLLAAPMTRGKT